MTASPHLGLDYLAPAQAQKHVTVNEALRRLDALVQLGVIDRTLAAPPPGPAEGDRHIVGPGATGAWAGQDGRIAAFADGVWLFIAPKPGWLAYVAAEEQLVAFVGGEWIGALAALSTLEALSRLGVGASADDVNRLAVAAPAALFTHAGAGVQLKINKAAPADTASVLFQDGYSGRAEFGLAGSDAFSLKVSADGASWITALSVDPASGAVDIPAQSAPSVEVAKFTSSGTWTKPAWARRVSVLLVGGGGGGGSGALRAAGVAVSGGGGGAPGPCVTADFLAADLPATVAVTVGAGGAGGAAVSATEGNGANGQVGGDTAFGALLRASSAANARGVGGSTATAAGGDHVGYRDLPSTTTASGGNGTTTTGGAGQNGYGRLSGPAGGGGGVNAANAEGAGGSAGSAFNPVAPQNAAGGAAPGGAGAAGAVFPGLDALLLLGGSGGGGAGGHAADGGPGGDGAAPGGAGGGGGASRNGRVSGAGGAGARGEAWIVSTR